MTSAEAIPGKPFGVARVVIARPPGDVTVNPEGQRFLLAEANGRVMYPVFSNGRVYKAIGEVLTTFLDVQLNTDSLYLYFLFQGDEPLDLTIFTNSADRLRLQPRRQSTKDYDKFLRRWWKEYHAAAKQQVGTGDYPPLVETYLTTMLSKRFGGLERLTDRPRREEPLQTLDLLLGAEDLHVDTLRESFLRERDLTERADLPLPPENDWEPRRVEFAADAATEPLAQHVPEECFYVRCGTFPNYLWLSDFLNDYSGDLRSLITRRGHRLNLLEKLQRQLCLKQTVLAEILGDQIIADVAIIGRDLFIRDGAAVGMLFQAKNGPVLKLSIDQQRSAGLDRDKDRGAVLQTVRIADRNVSFLSTPDNRVRSFYAIDGDFHLVTNSRAIVERFFAAGAGEQSLAASAEFRHARTRLPLDRDDTVFLYFSPAFFRELVGAQYQIELHRRLESVTDLELIRLATLAAGVERQPAETLDDLAQAALLPRGFGYRPDGSELIADSGSMVDTLRGVRGTYLPIPDVAIGGVTRREADRYAARASYYRQHWRQMDPLTIAIKRFALARENCERIAIEAHLSPLDSAKYGWLLSMLGPPNAEAMTMPPDDLISAQAVVNGSVYQSGLPVHHLFVGVRDLPPLANPRPAGWLKTIGFFQATPGYLGSWPRTGLLDWLPIGVSGPRDIYGFSPYPLGLWRRQIGDLSVLSFDRRILAETTPHIRPVKTDSLAQARLHVADLTQTKLSSWLNAISFERSRETSQGNVRLLHALSQQLHVPRDEALRVAEQLLDVELICSLGGKYKTVEELGGLVLWESSANAERMPATYRSPLLEWFRGLNAELIKSDDRVALHAELDMQRRPQDPKPKLPLFDLLPRPKKRSPEELPPPQR